MYAMLHQFSNDIRNCFLNINFRFSQTTFSQVIQFRLITVAILHNSIRPDSFEPSFLDIILVSGVSSVRFVLRYPPTQVVIL